MLLLLQNYYYKHIYGYGLVELVQLLGKPEIIGWGSTNDSTADWK